MMYGELIKNLRGRSQFLLPHYGEKTSYDSDLMTQAADAIEELQKAVIRLEDETGLYDELPTIYIYPAKWISVTERLPNCNGCYLVWRPHFFCGEIGMPSICYFDGSNTWHDSYGVDFTRTLHPEDVTYWMPLPEPPKDGER